MIGRSPVGHLRLLLCPVFDVGSKTQWRCEVFFPFVHAQFQLRGSIRLFILQLQDFPEAAIAQNLIQFVGIQFVG